MDVLIVACVVFVLAFAVLSGTALNPSRSSGVGYLKTARGIRFLLSAVLAAVAAAWIARRN